MQKIFYITCFGLFFILGISFRASADTQIGVNITQDTVWTASSSPYVVRENIEIAAGATLTLEPGTVIKITDGIGVAVHGSLLALGSADQIISITSYEDDSIGGDSNGNGTSTTPAAGDWRGIRFMSGSVGNFSYASIKYSGYNYRSRLSIPAIYNQGGVITVSNSSISESNNCALGQTAGELDVENSKISDHEFCGIAYYGGELRVYGNLIESTNYGSFINGTGTVEFIDTTFKDVRVAADINLSNKTHFVHSGNDATGGQFNGFVIRGTINNLVTLVPDLMPYIVTSGGGSTGSGEINVITENNLTVGSTGLLVLQPGTIVKLHDSGGIFVSGQLDVDGSTFTSIKDDTVSGDTNGDNDESSPTPGDWLHISFDTGSAGTINNANIRYGGHKFPGFVKGSSLANILNKGGTISITQSEISHGHSYGISNTIGTTSITQSSIHDNSVYGVINADQAPVLDARHNYWGNRSGPFHSQLNPEGLGDRVSSNVLIQPWKGVYCTANCYSNVLFLPGIQASRLYLGDGEEVSNRLWEPSNNDDIRTLALTEQGSSIIDIRTEDIIDEAGVPIVGSNIYKDFMSFMNGLEDERVINKWRPFAYDWRYDVFEIVKNGTKYRDGSIRNPVDELLALAEDSFSGKVTIIGHSNGGLLAKAIMIELEARGKADLVDKIVFIGTPQLGTPIALGTLLHGYDQEKLGGLIIDDGVAREVMRNLPGVYSLLPSAMYLQTTGDSVVYFDNSQVTAAFRNEYGESISEITNLTNFLNAAENVSGRSSVSINQINMPIIVNEAMLRTGLQNHREKLDTWVPPQNTKVFQIVGTGLPTVDSIEYREVEETICPEGALSFIYCVKTKILKPHVRLTSYGDETVVSNSADYGEGVVNYYFDLDKAKEGLLNLKKNHANLTEADQVQTFVRNNISAASLSGIDFISEVEPVFSETYDIEAIDSPVRIYAIDTEERITGLVEENGNLIKKEEIPNSTYFEFGGTKYLVIPSETERTTHLIGEELGGYTLTISALDDSDNQSVQHQVVNATTTLDMRASFNKKNGTYSTIQTDIDGDGTYDYENTIDNESIIETPTYSYQTLLSKIKSLKIKKDRRKLLLTLAEKAKKLNNRSQNSPLLRGLEELALELLKVTVMLYERKNLLSEIEAADLITIINYLR